MALTRRPYTLVTLQGNNASVGTAAETLWDGSTAFAYPASALATTVSSGSANDAAAGTGARTVFIEGLNANYVYVSETATLNGQTGVALTNSYLRVFKCTAVTAGSGGVNAGIVYVGTGAITTGVPAVINCQMAVGNNVSMSAMYTIPAGKQGILAKVWFSTIQSTAGERETCQVWYATPSGIIQPIITVIGTLSSGVIDVSSCADIPLQVFPEKTDIELRATSSTGTSTVTGGATLLVIAP